MNHVIPDEEILELLDALNAAIACYRCGTPGRLHLTPLDVYAAGEQYPDGTIFDDLPPADWQSRDDDPGMHVTLFCARHNCSVYTQTHKEYALLDTAGGTLPKPPNRKRPAPPFGIYKGWKIFNRMHRTPRLPDDCLADVRNPALLFLTESRDGGCLLTSDTTSKYPDYWELLKEVFEKSTRYGGKVWVLAVGAEEPLTEPEELKKPCYGFAVDTTARTLELTERGDALRMFRDAVSRLTQP